MAEKRGHTEGPRHQVLLNHSSSPSKRLRPSFDERPQLRHSPPFDHMPPRPRMRPPRYDYDVPTRSPVRPRRQEPIGPDNWEERGRPHGPPRRTRPYRQPGPPHGQRDPYRDDPYYEDRFYEDPYYDHPPPRPHLRTPPRQKVHPRHQDPYLDRPRPFQPPTVRPPPAPRPHLRTPPRQQVHPRHQDPYLDRPHPFPPPTVKPPPAQAPSAQAQVVKKLDVNNFVKSFVKEDVKANIMDKIMGKTPKTPIKTSASTLMDNPQTDKNCNSLTEGEAFIIPLVKEEIMNDEERLPDATQTIADVESLPKQAQEALIALTRIAVEKGKVTPAMPQPRYTEPYSGYQPLMESTAPPPPGFLRGDMSRRPPPYGYPQRGPPSLSFEGPPRILAPGLRQLGPRYFGSAPPGRVQRGPQKVRVAPKPLVLDRAPRNMPSVKNQGTFQTLLKIIETQPYKIKYNERYNYQSEIGTCCCWKIEFAGASFEAEGTTPFIAKALAAYDALAHLGAPEFKDCELICNMLDEFKQCQLNRDAYVDRKVLEFEEEERKRGMGRVDQQTLNFKRANIKGSLDVLGTSCAKFQEIKRIYGNGKPEISSFYGASAQNGVTATMVMGGGEYNFTEHGHDKRAALYNLALRVEQVIPQKETWLFVDDPCALNGFRAQIAEKAQSFTNELLSEFPEHYIRRHNYTYIMKVLGEEEELDKCTIVAFGNGTKVVEKSKMQPDGTVINDCCGEALCYRAFRRYLLDQIELSATNCHSIFTQVPDTKTFELLPDIKFILFKNNIPFGDCRYFDCEKDQAENAHVYKNPKSKAEIAKKAKKAARTARNDRKQWEYREIDEGRIQLYKLQDAKIGSHRDLTGHPKSTLETMEDYHCIVSPSDKMALRAICGCQGALLSLLLKKPVFLTEYHFFANQRKGTSLGGTRQEALERGLYNRLAGGTYDNPCPKPLIKVLYKDDWMRDSFDDVVPYSFLWFEGGNVDILKSTEGKSVQRLRPKHPELLKPYEIAAIEKQETNTATPSKYCTAEYYTSFSYLCKILDIPVSYKVSKILDIPVDTYVGMKNRAEVYMRNKLAVYEELRSKGKGDWPEKVVFAEF